MSKSHALTVTRDDVRSGGPCGALAGVHCGDGLRLVLDDRAARAYRFGDPPSPGDWRCRPSNLRLQDCLRADDSGSPRELRFTVVAHRHFDAILTIELQDRRGRTHTVHSQIHGLGD